MIDRRGLIAAGAALAFAPRAFAQQAPETRLFKDSQFLVRDRFSVEIVGRGKDLIFVPGLSSSRETWKVSADPPATGEAVLVRAMNMMPARAVVPPDSA